MITSRSWRLSGISASGAHSDSVGAGFDGVIEGFVDFIQFEPVVNKRLKGERSMVLFHELNRCDQVCLVIVVEALHRVDVSDQRFRTDL
jgi:hypothetical protein